jgi:hypothetical protein
LAKTCSTDYIDWNQAKRASFPNLKPSTRTISIRLPEDLFNEIKTENIISSRYQCSEKIE